MSGQTVENKPAFLDELATFNLSGDSEVSELVLHSGIRVPVFINEFWTPRQRQADRMHEISYRACFKPQLPRFFIDRFTEPGDVVFDPFLGRGTTAIEAVLRGRTGWGRDINPLSRILVLPRLFPPSLQAIEKRLNGWSFEFHGAMPEELLSFYHPDTLRKICWMRNYFQSRMSLGTFDEVDRWIQMVATNRLTGHSPGFFSVYTMPPNQAVSVSSQQKINKKRNQTPPPRDVKNLILKKSRAMLRSSHMPEGGNGLNNSVEIESADRLESIADETVSLVVTSPPFLDVVDYQGDNWLRCWFNHIDPSTVSIWSFSKLEDWADAMTRCLAELRRVSKIGARIAFEVGEVRRGAVSLEETVVRCGIDVGLTPEVVIINAQDFTKTAHCWGVENQAKGTNTNRIVCFRRDN